MKTLRNIKKKLINKVAMITQIDKGNSIIIIKTQEYIKSSMISY
jgi:hypothetical protein